MRTKRFGYFVGKVVGISDGDTIAVMHGGKAEKVRLHGIACSKKAQPFGTKAKQYTSSLVFGHEIAVTGRKKDRYGRTVADVVLPDGRNLNQEIVTAGLAWWYQQYAPSDMTLQKLEAEARAAKIGLWAELDTAAPPVPPWDWRKDK